MRKEEILSDLNMKLCQTLFEEIQAAIFLTTKDLKIIRANVFASLLFGRSNNSIYGCNFNNILEQESQKRCKNIIDKLEIDGESSTVVLPVTDYIKITRLFNINIRYLSSVDRDNGYLLFILRTPKEENNNNYEQEIDTLLVIKKLLKDISDSVILIDYKSLTICDCNLVTEMMFGYSRKELLGRTPHFLVCDENIVREYIDNAVLTSPSTGFYQGKVLCRRKNNSRFMTLATNISFQNKQGNLQYILVINRDISAEERIFQNILKYAEQSKELAQKLYKSVLPLKETEQSQNLSDFGFTRRQILITSILITGEPTKKIASMLNLSESSIKKSLSLMYRKIQVSSRVEFIKFINDHRLGIE